MGHLLSLRKLLTLWVGLALFVSVPSVLSYLMGGKMEFSAAMERFLPFVMRFFHLPG
jgi:hypothetical protein